MCRLCYWKFQPDSDSGRIGIFSSEIHPCITRCIIGHLRIILVGIVVIWTLLCLYYSSVYKCSTFAHNVVVQIVDLDGGPVGANITQMVLDTPTKDSLPIWSRVDGLGSSESVETWIRDSAWSALVINPALSDSLSNTLHNGSSYNSSQALTVIESSDRHPTGEMMFIKTAMRNAISTVLYQYSFKIVQAFQLHRMDASRSDGAQTTPVALLQPIGYTTVDESLDTSSNARLVFLSGCLCMMVCSLSKMLIWRTASYPLFTKVRFRDLAIM
ncbi:hypothetical protein DL89DRAFT_299569 [Linderina pennispora]|uniref:DUF3533 domain-containing protein n=1 Tax=Linderina pennispora TaxID=61395 RepID=A0A1Y1WK40_9FUNG|nr:uncharacterized protein DL89DRAFT_299569 [Linderina pennispora]ORX73950.1 hypothetical protein DL89DRAFT_299569 [Linderina pennispora]